MKKLSLLAACAFAAAALALLTDRASAQATDTTKKDTAAVRPAPTPTETANGTARPAGAISDSAIIAMLQLSHAQEIAAAEMAAQRAQSPRVKRFAETLKTDHGKALQDLDAYAQRMQTTASRGMPSGVRDPSAVGRRDSAMVRPDSGTMLSDSAKVGREPGTGRRDSVVTEQKPAERPEVSFDNIQGLTGHEFDHGFVRLQVQHHQTEINHLRNDVIPMIRDSGLKSLVQGQLPILGRRLTEARELEAVLKTTN